jgi:transcriptional regulator with GAF, ATPase, and Fis domain
VEKIYGNREQQRFPEMLAMKKQDGQIAMIPLLQVIDTFALRLQNQKIGSKEWKRLMEILCSALDGSGAALYLRQHKNDKSFYFKCLASCQRPRIKKNTSSMFPSVIESTSSEFWHAATRQELHYHEKLEDLHSKAWHDVFVSPISSETGPFGCIFITGCRQDHLVIDSSLSVISKVFSLWANRCNVIKQLKFPVFKTQSRRGASA